MGRPARQREGTRMFEGEGVIRAQRRMVLVGEFLSFEFNFPVAIVVW